MNRFFGIGIFSVFILLNACQNKEGKAVTEHTQTEEVDTTQQFTYFNIDTAQSVVTWISSSPKRKLDGIVPFKEGQLVLSEQGFLTGQFTLDLANLKISDFNLPKGLADSLEKQALSPDWLHIQQYPTATFILTSVSVFDTTWVPPVINSQSGPNQPESYADFMVAEPTHLLSVNLTLMDITKEITIPVLLDFNPENIRIEGRFNIDRNWWNLHPKDTDQTKGNDQVVNYDAVNLGFFLVTINDSNQ